MRPSQAHAPNYLAFLLPASVLSQSNEWMFPTPWHQLANHVWGLQAWILFIHCVLLRRWLPSQWASSRAHEAEHVSSMSLSHIQDDENESVKPAAPWRPPFTVIQFWLMLLTHSLFYIIELDSTLLTVRYVPMAYHHYIALLIFGAYLSNVNALCVLSLLPLLLHSLFWSLGATNFLLLSVYNLCMTLCGIAATILIFAVKSLPDRGEEMLPVSSLPLPLVGTIQDTVLSTRIRPPISYFLPFCSILIASVNYYTYCKWYNGLACDRGYTFSADRDTNFVYCSTFLFISCLGSALLLGRMLGSSDWFLAMCRKPAFVETFTETHFKQESASENSWDAPWMGGGRVSALQLLCVSSNCLHVHAHPKQSMMQDKAIRIFRAFINFFHEMHRRETQKHILEPVHSEE
ncbi:hypothetical protein BC830DRAFT_1153677 [Chytriomyces sp. MP71]|nr:hypothetical protein BC830DRAFT_1153677 [Chytriomyces sp. MP71]